MMSSHNLHQDSTLQSKDSFYGRDNMTSLSGSGADHHSQSVDTAMGRDKDDDPDDYLGAAGLWATEHMRKTEQQQKNNSNRPGGRDGGVFSMLAKLGCAREGGLGAMPTAPKMQSGSSHGVAPGRGRKLRQSGTKLALEQVEKWRGEFTACRASKRGELARVLAARKLDRVYVAESDLLMGKMYREVQVVAAEPAERDIVIVGLGDMVTQVTTVRTRVSPPRGGLRGGSRGRPTAGPGRAAAEVPQPPSSSPRSVEATSIWATAKKREPPRRGSGLVAKKQAKGEELYRSLLVYAVSNDFCGSLAHDQNSEDLIMFVKRRLEQGCTAGEKIYKDSKRYIGHNSSPATDKLLAFLKEASSGYHKKTKRSRPLSGL